MMILKDLLDFNDYNLSDQDLAKRVDHIDIDSRRIKDNSIFCAIAGNSNDGANFIDQAIKNGAHIIVCNQDLQLNFNKNITIIKTFDVKEFLGSILQKFYHNKLPDHIFAVTGTNGKTSVAEFSRQIFEILGKKAATIGTLGVNCSDIKVQNNLISSSLTSPDIVCLYHNLAILKSHNVDFVTIEASSIGLDQGRLDNIDFKAAAFTNFTQDHLDYHKNMDNYFAAKMILFRRMLNKSALAIINADSDNYGQIFEIAVENSLRTISYGQKGDNFQLISSKEINEKRHIILKIYDEEYKFELSLLENFQVINIICALSLVASYLELERQDLLDLTVKLIDLKAVEGRMEKVSTLKNGAKIYIDFAHSPDALENLITIAKKQAPNRVVILFGCGGDRDVKKGLLWEKIADDLADFIIVTDDNPRSEDPVKIRRQIIKGISNKNKMIEVSDRKNAIEKAISLLKNDDILIIAGKGHEKYQIVGDKYFPFDEKDIVKLFVNNNCN